jgi:hypothetical protein
MIILIVSYPKSGNTWMRRFLCCYTRNRKVPLNEMASIAPIDSSIGLWKNFAGVDFDPTEGLNAIKRKGEFFKALRSKIGENKIILKAHSANVLVEGENIYPSDCVDRVIHIVRHPLDVLPSYSHHMGMEIEKAWGSMNNSGLTLNPKDKQLKEYLSSWDRHTDSWMAYGQKNPEKYLQVRYEDLLSKPITSFQKVIKHCEFNYSELKLAKSIVWSDFKEMKTEEESLESGFKEAVKGRKFFRSGTVGDGAKVPLSISLEMKEKYKGVMKKLKYEIN